MLNQLTEEELRLSIGDAVLNGTKFNLDDDDNDDVLNSFINREYNSQNSS